MARDFVKTRKYSILFISTFFILLLSAGRYIDTLISESVPKTSLIFNTAEHVINISPSLDYEALINYGDFIFHPFLTETSFSKILAEYGLIMEGSALLRRDNRNPIFIDSFSLDHTVAISIGELARTFYVSGLSSEPLTTDIQGFEVTAYIVDCKFREGIHLQAHFNISGIPYGVFFGVEYEDAEAGKIRITEIVNALVLTDPVKLFDN